MKKVFLFAFSLLLLVSCENKKNVKSFRKVEPKEGFKPNPVLHQWLGKNIQTWGKHYKNAHKAARIVSFQDYLLKSSLYYFRQNLIDSALLYSEAAEIASKISGDSAAWIQALNLSGNCYKFKYSLDLAEKHITEALTASHNIDSKEGMFMSYGNLGRLYFQKADYKSALENYEKALENADETIDSLSIAWTRYELARLFLYSLDAVDKAKSEAFRIYKVFKQYNHTNGIILSNRLLGKIALAQDSTDVALDYFTRSLNMCRDTLSISNCVSDIGMVYFKKAKENEDYRIALNYLLQSSRMKANLIEKYGVAPLEMPLLLRTIGQIYLRLNKLDSSILFLHQSLKLAQEHNLRADIRDSYSILAEYYEKAGNYKKAYECALNHLNQLKNISEIRLAIAEDYYKKEQARNKIASEMEQNKRNRLIISAFAVVILMLLFLIFLIYRNYRLKKYTNLILERQKRTIETEKLKSERLLLNILPAKVAAELKEGKNPQPRLFKEVSVLLTDFVDFTKTAQNLPPEILIEELNQMYTAFDEIIARHHCERIKTIGDAYLAVSGLPESTPDHLDNIIAAAFEMLDYLEERNKKNATQWQMRLGLHTGEVIGAVVGITKYHYDIFGDVVNTVSRLEALSEPMKINVSRSVYEMTANKYRFVERPPVKVKGIERLEMWFLEKQGD